MKKKIILTYPFLGFWGSVILDLPMSLLYLAIDSIKAGYDVKLLDFRIDYKNWKDDLRREIDNGTLMVGVSVMSGIPIQHSLEITKFVKDNYKDTPVVWGGPHPSVVPEQVLDVSDVDFVIRGYGSQALLELANELNKKEVNYNNVKGLAYRQNGRIAFNPMQDDFEVFHFSEIPYHLIEKNLDRYTRLKKEERIFPIFGSFGCPYGCTFCMRPYFYKDLKKRWVPLQEKDVVDHIKFLIDKYKTNYIYFYDDTAFVDVGRMVKICELLIKEGIKIKLGFRGLRINELSKLTDNDLKTLVDAGVEKLHIGIESGSARMLDLIKKNSNVDLIIEQNRKLARFPQLKPQYNFIGGLPSEKLEDLYQTSDLIFKLIEDNPNCVILPINKYMPLPGTELYQLALNYGFREPKNMDQWIDIDAERDFKMPWYEKGQNQYLNLMYMASFFIDNKIESEKLHSAFSILHKYLSKTLKPVYKWRLKHHLAKFSYDFYLFNLFTSLSRKMLRHM